jgi:hypothetical protein
VTVDITGASVTAAKSTGIRAERLGKRKSAQVTVNPREVVSSVSADVSRRTGLAFLETNASIGIQSSALRWM